MARQKTSLIGRNGSERFGWVRMGSERFGRVRNCSNFNAKPRASQRRDPKSEKTDHERMNVPGFHRRSGRKLRSDE